MNEIFCLKLYLYSPQLLAFLILSHPQVAGRSLKVEVAASTPKEGGHDRRRSGRGDGGRGGTGRNGRTYERQYSNDSYRSNSDGAILTPVDGSQFRGGRYSRSTSNMSEGSIGGVGRNGSGVMKRSDSSASAGSAVAAERPSLKLAPRTKPVEDNNSGGSSTSIFGEAKPRDEKEIEEKKAAVKNVTRSMSELEVVKESNGVGDGKEEGTNAGLNAKDEDKTEKKDEPSLREIKSFNRKPSRGAGRGGDRPERNNSDRKQDRRKSGRGEGRGEGRGGGRGDGRNSVRGGKNNGRESGKRNSAKARNDDSAKDGSEAPVSSLTAAAMPVKQENKAPPKKANSFAAFMDDSDDE